MEDALATARVLVEIQEEERRAIARELHDRLGQSLAVLKLLLGEAANAPLDRMRYTIGEAQALTNEMMSLARELSLELRPKMLDDLGLLPALLYLFESYTSRTHVQVRFEHYGLHKKFPPQAGLAAYRIVKEALENVASHAGVDEARVLAWSDRRVLSVRVEDRGNGFDPGTVATDRPGGINGMRGRAQIAGGSLSLKSARGQGSVVTAELPLLQKARREPGEGQ
jgi:signal transduction histidine kinase